MHPLPAAMAAVAAIFIAARVHGRAVRQAREAAGYPQANFRGANPEPVEALWRRDRERVWATFAIFATAGLSWTALGPHIGLDFVMQAGLLMACSLAGALVVAGLFASRLGGSKHREGRTGRVAAWAAWVGVLGLVLVAVLLSA